MHNGLNEGIAPFLGLWLADFAEPLAGVAAVEKKAALAGAGVWQVSEWCR